MTHYPATGRFDPKLVRGTIAYLKECQRHRAMRERWVREDRFTPGALSPTNDPEWLVDMAINRRAGWPDDPSHSRGSAHPVKRWAPGFMVAPIWQYPKRASGDFYRHLALIAHEVNTPRLVVRAQRLGECRDYLVRRLPERFTLPGDDW